MRRRDFLKNSLIACGPAGLPLVRNGWGAMDKGSSSKSRVQYARETIPPFSIPPYRGQSYDDKVPDTYDVAERSKLGINGLTSITDADADYEMYFMVDFFRNPPTMRHDFSDWVQICEGLQEALPLLRVVTGD